MRMRVRRMRARPRADMPAVKELRHVVIEHRWERLRKSCSFGERECRADQHVRDAEATVDEVVVAIEASLEGSGCLKNRPRAFSARSGWASRKIATSMRGGSRTAWAKIDRWQASARAYVPGPPIRPAFGCRSERRGQIAADSNT
jgi:hypothetical protein